MKLLIVKTLVFVLAVSLIPTFNLTVVVPEAQAAINLQINYQGKLTNTSDVAVANGDYNMEFILYDAISGGTTLWTETRTGANKVTVTNGLFSVMLGSVTSLASVDFNQTVYLGVNIGGTGTPGWDGEMSPRKIIGAVPAAFLANGVNGTGGVRSTLSSATALTIAKAGTDYALQVDTSTASAVTGLKVTSAAAAGGLSLSTLSTGTNENLTLDAKGSGTISLGATSTGNVLFGGGYGSTGVSISNSGNIQANGNLTVDGTATVTTSVSTPSIITASGALGVTPAAGSNLNVNLSTTGDLAVNTNQLYVDTSAARVGIGTASPAAKLHIYSAGGLNSGINLEASSASSYGVIDFNTNAGLAGQFLATGSSFSNGIFTGDQLALANYLTNGSTTLVAGGTNGFINFATGGYSASNERMRIDSAGRVGIMNTSPSALLTLGTAGTTAGTLSMAGATSGIITMQPQAVAGTYNFNLPTTAGASGYILTSAGGGASPMTWTDPSGLGVRWNSISAPTGNASIAMGSYTTDMTFNSATSGNIFSLSSSSLTTGNLVNLASTSTAAGSNTQTVLNVATSGANGTSTQTTYGAQFANTHSGTSSTNIAAYFTASGGTDNYAIIVPSTGGNSGFGTTTPTNLSGAGSYFGNNQVNPVWVSANDPSKVTALVVQGNLGQAIQFIDQTGTAKADFGYYSSEIYIVNRAGGGTRFYNNATNVAMFLDSNANLGLGTSTSAPASRLEVKGASGQLSTLIGDAGYGTGYAGISVNGTFASNSYTLLGDASNLMINRPSGGDMYFREGNTTQMILKTSTGNLGIGDTSPAALLTVGSGDLFQVASNGNLTSSNAGTWTFSNDTNIVLSGGLNGLAFDTDVLSIDATSNRVGFGTTSPSYPVDVVGTARATDFIAANTVTSQDYLYAGQLRVHGTGGSGEVQLWSNSNQRLTVLSSGEIGIGTTGPDRKLDVLDASNPQLRLTYTDGSVYTDLQTNSSGDLKLRSTGDDYYVLDNSLAEGAKLSLSDSGNNEALFDLQVYRSGVYSSRFKVNQFGQVSMGTSGTYNGIDNVGIGIDADAKLEIGGNFSSSAWGLNGIQLQASAGTYTDSSTATSGTATNAVFNSFAVPTLAATNATVTTTNAATLYIAGAPTAGTNQTITNAYPLWVDAGTSRFDGAVVVGDTSASAQLQVSTASNGTVGVFINGTSGQTANLLNIGKGGNPGYFQIDSTGNIVTIGGVSATISASAGYAYFPAGKIIANGLQSSAGFNFITDSNTTGVAYTTNASADGVQIAHTFNSINTLVSGNKIVSFKNNGTEKAYIDYNGNLSVGSVTSTGALSVVTTTSPQLTVGYDNSNKYTTAVSSAGSVTFDAVGASAGFVFSDAISSPGVGSSSERFGASSTAAGNNSLAVGNNSSATGAQSIAIGKGASAQYAGSISIGYNATQTNAVADNYGIAIGYSASSDYTAVALGGIAVSSGNQNVAVGYDAQANGPYQSTALGGGARANATWGAATAVGWAADAVGSASVALGSSSTSAGYSVVIGMAASAGNSSSNLFNIAIGQSATISSSYSGTIVMGAQSAATGNAQFIAGSSNYPINDIYFGKGATNATATAYTINGTGGSGTDIAGAAINIAGGKGTGTGVGGDVLFKLAYPTTTGSSLNSLTTVATFNADNNDSSGTQNLISLTPTVNQSGTAGYNGLLLNVTETATGSGTKSILDLQRGSVSKFRVTPEGGLITGHFDLAYGGQISSGTCSGGSSVCLVDKTNSGLQLFSPNIQLRNSDANQGVVLYNDGAGQYRLILGRQNGLVEAGYPGINATMLTLQGSTADSGSAEGVRIQWNANVASPTAGSKIATFGYLDNVAAYQEKVTILASGNFGIGTTGPSAMLHVVKSDNGTDEIAKFFANNLTQGIGINYNSILAIGSNTNQNISITPKGSGDIILTSGRTGVAYTPTSGTAALMVNGAAAVGSSTYLNASAPTNGLIVEGNVGIGDTSPAALLTVGSGDLFQVNSSGAIAAATGITSSGTITFSGLGGGGTQCVNVSNTGVLGTTTCGGALTPWTSDIDADGYDLNDLSNILFRETTGAPTSTDVGLFRDNSGDLNLNVLSGKTFNVQVAGTDEYNFSSSALAMNSNNITGVGTAITATAGLTVTATSANLALVTATSGNITLAPASTGSVQITSGVATGTTTSSGFSLVANSVNTGTAQYISTTALTSGNSLQVQGSGATMQTGGELIDLALGANTVGAGLTITSTGAYTGTGAADGLINITANGLTSGYGMQIAHTTSVISTTGSLMRLSSSSIDTGTTGTLLSLSSTGSTAGTIAMITNNTSNFTGTSLSVSNTGLTSGAGLVITGSSVMNSSGRLIDLQTSTSTQGVAIKVANTGVYTNTAGLVQIGADSLTTGVAQTISVGGITSGAGLRITGTSGAFTMLTGGSILDINHNNARVGAGVRITSVGSYNGTAATDGLLNITADSLSSGHAAKINVNNMTSGSGLVINTGANLSTGGKLIDLQMGAATAGNGLNIATTGVYTGTGLAVITANSATTGNVFATSATGLTTGYAQQITLGSGLTTGGAVNISGGVYAQSGASSPGYVMSINFTNLSTNSSGQSSVYGINMTPSLSSAGTGIKNTRGIVIAPTNSGCAVTGGVCNYFGVHSSGLSMTNSTTGLVESTALYASTGSATQNTAAGSITFYGTRVEMGTLTQTTGSVIAYGQHITTGGITTAGTMYGSYIAASGVGAGTLQGLNISNITGGAGTETALSIGSGWDTGISNGSSYVQSAGTMSLTSANTTQVTTASALALNVNSLTSGTGLYTASSTLTSGKLVDLQVSGTAAAASQTALNILTTGANGTAGITTYGAQISNTHSTNTSTNVGLLLNATGGATANYALVTTGGNVGIGTTAPGALLTIEDGTSSDQLRIGDTSAGYYYKLGRNTTTGYFEFDGTQSGFRGYIFNNSGNATFNNADNFIVSSNGSANMRITSTAAGASSISGIALTNSTQAYTWYLDNRGSGGSDHFGIANNAGTEMFAISTGGNFTLSGGATSATTTLDLGGTGTANAVCHTTQTGTNDEGLVDCTSAPAADFAEMYPVTPDAEVGDVVVTGTEFVNTYETAGNVIDWTKVKGQVVRLTKSAQSYAQNVVGIVSDNYGDFISTGYNIKPQDNPKSIALVGRVPVKVSTENGEIKAGDFLTSSATLPGFAMKATTAGPVIGMALADFNSSATGKVMVFVKATTYNGVRIESELAGLDFDYTSNTSTVSESSEQILTKLISQIASLNNDNLSELNTDLVIANAEVISPNVTTGALRANTFASAASDGGIEVESATIFKGGLKVDNIGSLGNLLTFLGDTEFIGTPYLNKDTAGFAVVSPGATSVDITFTNTYAVQPIVGATISFEQNEDLDEITDSAMQEVLKQQAITDAQNFLTEGVSYVITNKSSRGFTIVLNKPATKEVKFSWTAFAVKNANVFTSIESSPSPDNSGILNNEGIVSGDSTGAGDLTPPATREPDPTPTPDPVVPAATPQPDPQPDVTAQAQ